MQIYGLGSGLHQSCYSTFLPAHMCKVRPTMPGETNHHANVVFSGRAFLLILLVVLVFCLCRRGYCLQQWVLGPRFLQQPGLHSGAMPGSNNTASIQMQAVSQQPATAPPPVTDQVAVEIENLKRSNQLLELQQRRSQLLAPPTVGDQGGSRIALSAKYPVHLGSQ